MKCQIPIIPMLVATGCGSGFWPWGPGTAGAVFATLLWVVGTLFVSPLALTYITLAAIVMFTLAGTWATSRLQPYWGDDPSRVVVDEMVGVWIPLMACRADEWVYIVASLLLFRFFDILKPLGIRLLDCRKGAFWVMADDILAGIYSLIVILLLKWAI